MNTLSDLPTSRADAKASGAKHYFSGKPCPQGHNGPRFASTGGCCECLRIAVMAKYQHTTSRRRAYNDQQSFIAAATERHAGKYTYERAVYQNAHTPLTITCAIHGAFPQSPTNHIQGKGCPACRDVAATKRCLKTLDEFLKDANAVWGTGTYDYSLVEYAGSHTAIKVICPKHGVFTTTPTTHLSGAQSCSKCNHMKSKGEEAVRDFCNNLAPTQWRVKPFPDSQQELDVFIPSAKLAVEYCGEYYHAADSEHAEPKMRTKHYKKYLDAKAIGVRIITLYESEWRGRNYAIRRLLRNVLGKGRGKVMARKCELRKVPHAEACAFYDRYHPQGGAGAGEHYGLYWGAKLVACMRFTFGANDRGAGAAKRVWTLTRYATRVTVSGGASRLFTAFLTDANPEVVKSFSDNRFFDGGMYAHLGFVLEEETSPDYHVWHNRLGLRSKASFQRREIPKRLAELGIDDTFDPETDPRTEAEMTYLMGARRLYDCGKKRWVWTRPA